MPSEITYAVYQKLEGEGPAFYCHLFENGSSRMFHKGDTAQEAVSAALVWADKNLNTPERQARIAAAAQRRVEAKRNVKAREVV